MLDLRSQQHQIVTCWSEVGPWHIGRSAPNGCVSGSRQRRISEVQIYLADYYGKGDKVYMQTVNRLQVGDENGDITYQNSSNDGNVAFISRRAASVGIELTQ